MKKILVFIVISFYPVLSHAVNVEKSEWVESMEIALPAAFCKKQMYFRQCFTVDAIECEEVAASVTRICLRKYKSDIPNPLKQPQDGTKWGTIVGRCAGSAYETSLINKKINSEKCNDANNWK